MRKCLARVILTNAQKTFVKKQTKEISDNKSR